VKPEQTTIVQLEDWFKGSEDATVTARTEAERARDYVDGVQLTSEEVSELTRRGQPPVVINRIRRKIEWLKGLEVKQRADPKAFPRTPKHQEEAESVTEALRFVCDDQDWDAVNSDCYDDFLVEGFCGVEIVHKQNKRGVVDVIANYYPWNRLFYDPHSRKPDFSDARFKGVVLWMDIADFKKAYPKQSDAVDVSMTEAVDAGTYDDQPNNIWIDAKRNRVRVILMWHREGDVWHWCKFIKGQKLEGGESPYMDDLGESVCPLIMQSSHVGRENNRYGVVRDMFDPQDEINKRRSKALHGINSRQTMGIAGAVQSVTALKRELAKPDGHVEISVEAYEAATRSGSKPFEIIPTADQTSGQFSLLQEAKQEIDMMGANSALAGETGNNTSGRAVLARQQGGMIELASLSDRRHQFNRNVYRHMWMRIKQFWTEERWIPVTDDEKNVKFVGINRPITFGEQLGQIPEEEAVQIAMQMGLTENDPRLQQQTGVQNSMQDMDVDIIIEETPDRVTLEGEAFEALLKYGPQIPPAVLIEADPSMPAKKKEKLLKLMQEPPPPSPSDQLDLADKEAGIMVKQSQAAKLQSEAQAPLAQYG
jgi:hypothetical protein